MVRIALVAGLVGMMLAGVVWTGLQADRGLRDVRGAEAAGQMQKTMLQVQKAIESCGVSGPLLAGYEKFGRDCMSIKTLIDYDESLEGLIVDHDPEPGMIMVTGDNYSYVLTAETDARVSARFMLDRGSAIGITKTCESEKPEICPDTWEQLPEVRCRLFVATQGGAGKADATRKAVERDATSLGLSLRELSAETGRRKFRQKTHVTSPPEYAAFYVELESPALPGEKYEACQELSVEHAGWGTMGTLDINGGGALWYPKGSLQASNQ